MARISMPAFRRRHLRLLTEIRGNTSRLLTAMIGGLLMAGTSVSMAYFIKPVIDDVFVRRDVSTLRIMPFVVVGIFFLRGLGYFSQEYFLQSVGASIVRNLRNLLYDRITDLPVSFFQGERTGALMSRVTWDVNLVKEMVSRAVTSIIRDFFTVLGLIGVIFYRDWKLALYAVVILPVAYYPIVFFGKRIRRVATGCQEAVGEITSFLQETFLGNKIVKAFGMEPYEKKRFHEKTESLFRLEVGAAAARSATSPIMEFLAGAGIALVIWYGGRQVITGASTAGDFFSFMAAVLMLYDPVKKISYLNNALGEGLAAADRIFDIVEREPDIVEKKDAQVLPRSPHTVRMTGVGFSYEPGQDVLKDINLTVPPGSVVALVGASGGGKSTLVNLIPRFFDVTAGSVSIDGQDIRDLSIASLRDNIAIVTQEPILFADSVAANIAYGKHEASREEIEAAARSAFAFDFVSAFPKGFDAQVGELGTRLSGGERQRLCIARALIKDAPILILDEATSSLDTESERVVQKALENLMEGRTSFVIAHRLSTIRRADHILVVVNGRIVESGTHEELLQKNGEYAKLYTLQFAEKD
ncbi:MAG: lipid A export permease/ATP-binding protein MsbA [Thermodesulfobacteriota bacterium]